MIDAIEIAAAFTATNAIKSWRARVYGTTVHFSSTNGTITLVYDTEGERFAVKFHKYVAAWGDYVKAIARALYTVLNTLKAGGLPFEAPQSLEGAVIVCSTGADNSVFVSWQGLEKPDLVSLAMASIEDSLRAGLVETDPSVRLPDLL